MYTVKPKLVVSLVCIDVIMVTSLVTYYLSVDRGGSLGIILESIVNSASYTGGLSVADQANYGSFLSLSVSFP